MRKFYKVLTFKVSSCLCVVIRSHLQLAKDRAENIENIENGHCKDPYGAMVVTQARC